METVNKPSRITFYGAAGTVTGSKYLIEAGSRKILVDCGLFQGLKELRQRNWDRLPFDVSSLDCVLLSHGHLDHTGYLPLLVKQGFKGNIYASEPTVDIAKLILLDSGKIQAEDAARANTFHYSKHKPAKPLYTVKEAEAVFPLFAPQPEDQWLALFPEISFRFRYNGHILGSAFIEFQIAGKKIVFSGDLGRDNDPLLFNPKKPEDADVVIIESTYGNKIHPKNQEERLAEALNKAAEKQGVIIIPGFAVERAQMLMYYLQKLQEEKRIPPLPIYMDSPMGKNVIGIFNRHPTWHKLSDKQCSQIFEDITIIKEPEETEQLAADKTPKIIIAASGMATGGRVLSYFEHHIGDPNATILLTGYQGEGTRGRALLDGAGEIKMRGKFWPVKATIVMIEGLSAHADKHELVSWMSTLKKPPQQLFIVHGEREAAEALKASLTDKTGLCGILPAMNETFNIF